MDFSQLNSHSPEIHSHLSKAPHVGDPKQENSISLIGTTWTTNLVENNITLGTVFRSHTHIYIRSISIKSGDLFLHSTHDSKPLD